MNTAMGMVMLTVKTAAQSLDIRRIAIEDSRYPLEMEASFSSDDEPSLKDIQRICVRGMQMCSHETYMDCPFFEQLMYVGDTRLEKSRVTESEWTHAGASRYSI